MLGEFKQYVPSYKCMTCVGCCRFNDPISRWRPRLGKGETTPFLTVNKMSPHTTVVDEQRYIMAFPRRESYACGYLSLDDHTCHVYETRPFECQLYPFLIVREQENLWLGVHLNCPFIAETRETERFPSYLNVLKEFFSRDEVLFFLRNNEETFPAYQDSRDEIEMLFSFYRAGVRP